MATTKQNPKAQYRVTILVGASQVEAVAEQMGGVTVEQVQKIEPFMAGEWSQEKFPNDHYDEKRRGENKDGSWINTDGRRIERCSEFAKGQEKVPFQNRERVNVYRVFDQYGYVGTQTSMNEAKKLVRPINTVEETLKVADELAANVLKNATYDVDDTDIAKDYLAMRRIIGDECVEAEDGRRVPQYEVTLLIERSVLDKVQRDAKAAFGDKLKSVTKVEVNHTRHGDLMRAKEKVDEAAEIVGALRQHEEETRDNMPENFQQTEAYSAIEECMSSLESLEQELDGISFDIDFPQMYGG